MRLVELCAWKLAGISRITTEKLTVSGGCVCSCTQICYFVVDLCGKEKLLKLVRCLPINHGSYNLVDIFFNKVAILGSATYTYKDIGYINTIKIINIQK
jgi:hypothetical protein